MKVKAATNRALGLLCSLWAALAAGMQPGPAPMPGVAPGAGMEGLPPLWLPGPEAAQADLAAQALATNNVQEKQFVVHWLYHYTGIGASIAEDPVGEAGITGRCSNMPITDAPNAPSMYVTYSWRETISTSYYQAPRDESSCTTRTNDVTFYKLTWVKSPTAQSVQAWFGSSDYFKLWINGNLVGSRTTGGPKPYTEEEYKYPVTLAAGWNLIVVRQTFPQLGPSNDPNPDNLYKYFSLRFVKDSSGTPVTNLVATFDPDPACGEPARNKAYSTKVLIPSVAHLPGTGGSQWRTDLEIYNGFPWAFEWRLDYFKEGNASGTPDSSKTLTLAPYESRVLVDALPSFFGISGDQKGYAWVAGPYYYWLTKWDCLQAKVYKQASTGTFSMGLPIFYVYDSANSGYFFNLRNGAYRTNVAFIPQPNQNAEYRVRLTMFGPDIPTPVTKEWPENPADKLRGMAQLNNVFQYMGLGSLATTRANLYFQIIDAPSGTAFFPYATVNDNGTSDPLFRTFGSSVGVPPM